MREAAVHATGDGRTDERDMATARATFGFAAPARVTCVRGAVRS